MTTGCIGLGGNVGDVADAFADALRSLDARGVTVHDVSPLYRTQPIGPSAGAPFLNACAVIESSLAPGELLAVLHAAEDVAGRRREHRWSERTLDLDLLLLEDRVIATDALTVPHPGVYYRRFVLDPLADVAAQRVVPPTGDTVSELRDRLQRRPLPVAFSGGTPELRVRLQEFVAGRFTPQQTVTCDESDADRDATIIRLPDAAVEPQAPARCERRVVVRWNHGWKARKRLSSPSSRPCSTNRFASASEIRRACRASPPLTASTRQSGEGWFLGAARCSTCSLCRCGRTTRGRQRSLIDRPCRPPYSPCPSGCENLRVAEVVRLQVPAKG